ARPKLVAFVECRNVKIENVTMRNSPSWTIHPLYCRDVLIDHVKVINPANSPNTDGIDPDSCKGVKIVGCELDCGDDCIALKTAITINMYYMEKPPKGQTLATMDIPAQPVGEGTPIFRDIHISNVTAKLCQNAGEIIGLPESPVLGLEMKNVSIEAEKGMPC